MGQSYCVRWKNEVRLWTERHVKHSGRSLLMAIEEGVVEGAGVFTTVDLAVVGISRQLKAEETLQLRTDVANSYLVMVEETLHLRAGAGSSRLARVEGVILRTHVVAGITPHLKVVASTTLSEVADSRFSASPVYCSTTRCRAEAGGIRPAIGGIEEQSK